MDSIDLLDFKPDSILAFLKKSTNSETHLKEYFGKYQGRFFELFATQSSTIEFTPWDFLAINSLSVYPTADAMSSFLVDRIDEFNLRLEETHKKINSLHLDQRKLWTIPRRFLASDNELSKLYEALKSVDGFGYVTASKLLALKFPDLIPIRDSKVEKLLQAQELWWEPMARVMKNEEIFKILTDLLDGIQTKQPRPSLLRVLDVLLWMRARELEQT